MITNDVLTLAQYQDIFSFNDIDTIDVIEDGDSYNVEIDFYDPEQTYNAPFAFARMKLLREGEKVVFWLCSIVTTSKMPYSDVKDVIFGIAARLIAHDILPKQDHIPDYNTVKWVTDFTTDFYVHKNRELWSEIMALAQKEGR